MICINIYDISMGISSDKKLVSFNANIEAWEAFKASAYENGTDASALLNQMIQGYISGDSSLQSAQDSKLEAVIEKLRTRLESVATRLDEAADRANKLPDLSALRDQTIIEWQGQKRLRIGQYKHIIDAFIQRLERAIDVGENSYTRKLKAEIERVAALYRSEQENSARLAERYDAAKKRLKVLGEEIW